MSYKSTNDLLVAIRKMGNCLDFLEAMLSDMHYAWNYTAPKYRNHIPLKVLA